MTQDYRWTDEVPNLEERVGQTGARRGEKSEVVIAAINRMPGDFSIAGLLEECPGVGVDLVRLILQTLRQSGAAECLGRGRSARWRLKTLRSDPEEKG